MTYQTLQSLSQTIIAIGIIFTALGGYGSYYFQKKIDLEKDLKQIPVVDLCRRGISVTKGKENTLVFDIPYCAGKNANAYNVKLKNSLILRTEQGLKYLYKLSDEFPDNVTLTYETGKSISYTLSPLNPDILSYIYIYVEGTYENGYDKTKYPVSDLFKFNNVKQEWQRALGSEDQEVRKFIKNPTAVP